MDQHVLVQCPLFCPRCNGPVRVAGKADQYQTDLSRVKPVMTCFEVHFRHCTVCGQYVQGRDRRQRSDALRVGKVVLGSGLIGMAAHLNKVCGLSYGKTASVLGRMFGVTVSRSGLARALLGLGRLRRPSYELVKSQLRASPVVYPDETGWRVNGHGAWLHVATDGKATTVWELDRGGRGRPGDPHDPFSDGQAARSRRHRALRRSPSCTQTRRTSLASRGHQLITFRAPVNKY